MKTVLVSTEMSQNGPMVSFKNAIGQDVYPDYVKYSIFSAFGEPVSGSELSAYRNGSGKYSISWIVPPNPGVFTVIWKYMVDGEELTTSTIYSYDSSLGKFLSSDLKLFTKCHLTTGYDFYIKFEDADGNRSDVVDLVWYISTPSGCLMTMRAPADRLNVGEYNVTTKLCYKSGDYLLAWEYKESPDSGLMRQTMSFSII